MWPRKRLAILKRSCSSYNKEKQIDTMLLLLWTITVAEVIAYSDSLSNHYPMKRSGNIWKLVTTGPISTITSYYRNSK